MKPLPLRPALCIFILLTSFNIRSQIIAYPDTAVCPGETVTLYADPSEYCGDCYSYHEIPFAFEPVGGTAFSMVDDTHTEALDIGFSFCFFGEEYTQFYLGANGWICFDEPTYDMDVNWTPDNAIPDEGDYVPKNAIFGPWTDWNPGICTDCIHYETTGVSPYRKCIITYDSVPLFVCEDFIGIFQIVLYETTNAIENNFSQVDVCAEWDSGWAIQGLLNSSGDIAFAVEGRNATAWSAENESWHWYNSDIKWYAGAALIDSGTEVTVNPIVTTVYTVVQTLCDGTIYSDDVTITMLTGGECDSIITTECDPVEDAEILELDTSSASIIWNSVTAAVNYIVQYKETISTTWNTLSIADTSVTLSDLIDCTNYIYRVGYICLGDTIFSEETNFTTDCIQNLGTEIYSLFSIGPNPANEYFTIYMNAQNSSAYTLMIYNICGEKVLEKNIEAGAKSAVILVDKLLKGPYVLSLLNDASFESTVLIIK